MKQAAAPTGLSINVVTAFAFALNAGMYIAAAYYHPVLAGGIVVSVSMMLCYFFWAPGEYELNDDELTVFFRVGRLRYPRVVKCSRYESKPGFGLRLFGNGGLFAGSGIFWSTNLGIFRAYVTTSRPGTMVMVETADRKVLISPADPQAFKL